MDINVKIKVSTLREVICVLDTLDTAEVKKNHPNVKITIEVAGDAD